MLDNYTYTYTVLSTASESCKARARFLSSGWRFNATETFAQKILPLCSSCCSDRLTQKRESKVSSSGENIALSTICRTLIVHILPLWRVVVLKQAPGSLHSGKRGTVKFLFRYSRAFSARMFFFLSRNFLTSPCNYIQERRLICSRLPNGHMKS